MYFRIEGLGTSIVLYPSAYFRSSIFREHKLSRMDRKVDFFVVLRKRLDPDRNKREKKTIFFQVFVVLGLVFVHQTIF